MRLCLKYACCILPLLASAAAAQPAAPEVAVALPGGSVRAGQPFEVAYTLTWADAEDTYVFVPQALPELDWGTWRLIHETGTQNDEGQTIQLTMEVTPSEAGDHELPALDFSFAADTDELENADLSVAAAPAQPVTAVEATNPRLPLLLGIAGAALLVLAILGALMLRRKPAAEDRQRQGPDESVRDALHAAQRCRLDGDYYGFYQQLSKVAGIAAANDQELITKLKKRTQSVGYGGVRPAEDELNGDQRAIERAVARWKEERGT